MSMKMNTKYEDKDHDVMMAMAMAIAKAMAEAMTKAKPKATPEPPDDLEFLSLPNLMVTPHIGGNANEAILAMGRSAIKPLKNYFL